MIGERILDLIRIDLVSPSNITGVTFTNLAAQEMKDKLLKLGLPSEDHPRLATLHHIAKGILHKEADKVGLSGNFGVADKVERNILARDTIAQLKHQGARVSAGSFKRWKEATEEMKARSSKATGPFSNGINPNDPNWKAYLDTYNNLLRLHDSVDWWDVIYLVVSILTTSKTRENYSIPNRHLLVDEYQDLNDADQELISLLCGSGAGLFVVGDDDQSIYETLRHSNPLGLTQFGQTFPNYQQAELMTCHKRPPVEILKAAKALISNNKLRVPKDFGTREKGGSVRKLRFKSAKEEKTMIAKEITRYLKGGDGGQRVLVLLPSHDLVKEYGEYLEGAGLQVKIYSKEQTSSCLRRLQIMLRLIDDTTDGLAVRQALDYLDEVEAEVIGSIQRLAMDKKIAMWDAVQAAIGQSNELKLGPKTRNSLSKLLGLIEELSQQAETLIVLRKLVQFIKCEENEEISEVVNWAEEKEELSLQNLLLRTGVDEGESEEAAAPASESTSQVEIMTMHNAKGITRDLVFIPGLEDELLPGRWHNIEEQRRLLYVSMTRAVQELILSHAWQRTGRAVRRFGSKSVIRRKPSRFLAEIPGPTQS